MENKEVKVVLVFISLLIISLILFCIYMDIENANRLQRAEARHKTTSHSYATSQATTEPGTTQKASSNKVVFPTPDAGGYYHAEDFYYDYYDDFFDYEEAEEWYNKNN